MFQACLAFVLAMVALTSCHDDDSEAVPAVKTGAATQCLIVFAPGQLGDKGYADRVLEGLLTIDELDQMNDEDRVDVNFLSQDSLEPTLKALRAWAANPVNPFYGNDYTRRLLVLTEPFMAGWLDDIATELRDSDEVLLLKTSQAVLDATAARTALDGRIHGLNISVASSIRKYCQLMRYLVDHAEELGYRNLNYETLPIFRLYSDSEVDYQDSIYTTLDEELGDECVPEVVPLSTLAGEGMYASDNTASIMTVAYNMADQMQRYYTQFGYGFTIVDLGSANTGFEYYLLGSNARYTTLMLDAMSSSVINRYYIYRKFDRALTTWGISWLTQPARSMPAMTWHGEWDGFCEDNITVNN